MFVSQIHVPLSPLCLKSINVSSGKDLKKNHDCVFVGLGHLYDRILVFSATLCQNLPDY